MTRLPGNVLAQQQARQQAALAGLAVLESSYNGLLLGGLRSPIGVSNIDGLSMPDLRHESAARLAAHGEFVFALFAVARILTYTGDISTDAGSAARQAAATALGGAFAPQETDSPLLVKLLDGSIRQINCKPSRLSFPIDGGYHHGAIPWVGELIAGDPRIYDATVQSIVVPPSSANLPGFGFPFDFPFGFGAGGVVGQTVATNDGTWTTLPVVTINGPITNPELVNLTTGESLVLAITLGPTDSLVLDFVARTITLNGTASRYSALQIGSVWWELQPGANALELIGSGFAAGTVATVVFQSAWGSV